MAALRAGDAGGDVIGHALAVPAVDEDQPGNGDRRQEDQELHAGGRRAVEQPFRRGGKDGLQRLEGGFDVLGGQGPGVVQAAADQRQVGDERRRVGDAQRGLTLGMMEQPRQAFGQGARQERAGDHEGQQGQHDQQQRGRLGPPAQPARQALVDGRQGDGQDDGPEQQADEGFGDAVAPIDQTADEADPDEEVKQAAGQHLLKIDVRTKAHGSVSGDRDEGRRGSRRGVFVCSG